jgi:hypothetical protein
MLLLLFYYANALPLSAQKHGVIHRTEASLDDTKRVVRAKLGLEPSVNLELAQLRGGSRIVLEDGQFVSIHLSCDVVTHKDSSPSRMLLYYTSYRGRLSCILRHTPGSPPSGCPSHPIRPPTLDHTRYGHDGASSKETQNETIHCSYPDPQRKCQR